jgi:hypothetical protein
MSVLEIVKNALSGPDGDVKLSLADLLLRIEHFDRSCPPLDALNDSLQTLSTTSQSASALFPVSAAQYEQALSFNLERTDAALKALGLDRTAVAHVLEQYVRAMGEQSNNSFKPKPLRGSA